MATEEYTKLADGSKYEYADGSSGDYYGIIRHSKNAGFSGNYCRTCFY